MSKKRRLLQWDFERLNGVTREWEYRYSRLCASFDQANNGLHAEAKDPNIWRCRPNLKGLAL